MYKDETELSILRGLPAGATWTASWRRGQQAADAAVARVPLLLPETEAHILRDCARWAEVHDEWLP